MEIKSLKNIYNLSIHQNILNGLHFEVTEAKENLFYSTCSTHLVTSNKMLHVLHKQLKSKRKKANALDFFSKNVFKMHKPAPS